MLAVGDGACERAIGNLEHHPVDQRSGVARVVGIEPFEAGQQIRADRGDGRRPGPVGRSDIHLQIRQRPADQCTAADNAGMRCTCCPGRRRQIDGQYVAAIARNHPVGIARADPTQHTAQRQLAGKLHQYLRQIRRGYFQRRRHIRGRQRFAKIRGVVEHRQNSGVAEWALAGINHRIGDGAVEHGGWIGSAARLGVARIRRSYCFGDIFIEKGIPQLPACRDPQITAIDLVPLEQRQQRHRMKYIWPAHTTMAVEIIDTWCLQDPGG